MRLSGAPAFDGRTRGEHLANAMRIWVGVVAVQGWSGCGPGIVIPLEDETGSQPGGSTAASKRQWSAICLRRIAPKAKSAPRGPTWRRGLERDPVSALPLRHREFRRAVRHAVALSSESPLSIGSTMPCHASLRA